MLLRHALAALLVLMFYTHTQAQNWQWLTRIGGPSADPGGNPPDESIEGIATDTLGNIYVIGKIRTPASLNGIPLVTYGTYDVFIGKFDCLGNPIWVRTAGGTGRDEGYGIALDGLGHLYVTGHISASSSNTCNFLGAQIITQKADFFLAKLDTSGQLIWLKVAGPPTNTLVTFGRKIQIDSKGMINVSGTASNISGDFFQGYPVKPPFYVARFDTSGIINRLFNFSQELTYAIYDFRLGPNDEMYVCGSLGGDSLSIGNLTLQRMSSNYDMLFAKFDSSGIFQWVKQWGVPGYPTYGYAKGIDFIGNDVVLNGRALQVLIDGVSGDSIFFTNPQGIGSDFPFVARMSSDGIVKWTASPSASLPGRSSGGVVTLPNGNSYISGWMIGTCSFGTHTFTSNTQRDMFVAAVDSSGNWIYASNISSTGTREEPECMAIDNQGNIYVGGGIDGTFMINGNTSNSLGGLTDAFVAKWGIVCPTALPAQPWGATAAGGLLVYPNPTQAAAGTATIAIAHSALSQGGTLTVYNMLGNVMLAQQVVTGNPTAHLLLPHCPPGMYLVRFANAHTQLTSKLLVVE